MPAPVNAQVEALLDTAPVHGAAAQAEVPADNHTLDAIRPTVTLSLHLILGPLTDADG